VLVNAEQPAMRITLCMAACRQKETAMSFVDDEIAIDIPTHRDDLLHVKHLVAAARSGSSAAFAELREIYAKRVYRKLLTMTRNREDAEDALQDAFLRAYLALHTFEERSSFYTWITTIAINSALMILRKRRRRSEVSFDSPNETEDAIYVYEFKDKAPSPEHLCVDRQRFAYLLESIWQLPPRLRQVIELQTMDNYSLREIAEALKISQAAVKSRLSRARARLATAHSEKGSEWHGRVESSSALQ
jgi:RNA polymerase sigma-70 factor (ECF subfamily)